MLAGHEAKHQRPVEVQNHQKQKQVDGNNNVGLILYTTTLERMEALTMVNNTRPNV